MFVGGILGPKMLLKQFLYLTPSQKPIANSIANMFYDAFGWAPAPIIYSVLQKVYGKNTSRMGMVAILNVVWISVITIACAWKNEPA